MIEKIEKYLPYTLIIFAVLTFYFMMNRAPFEDEAHSWLISKSFSFFELFKIEKYDGHFFIWHALQMPFSKNDFYYPYSIYILNWLFCMGALGIMWRFAPFSNILKTLITFSPPFFWYWAQVARCYSLGILCLFAIFALWQKRLNHPLIMAGLLIICANTSAIATICAFSLGLIFIFDLIKAKLSKKDLFFAFLILGFGVFLVGIQQIGAKSPVELVKLVFPFKVALFEFIFKNPDRWFFIHSLYRVFRIFACALFIVSLPYFYMKNKRAFAFFIISSICLSLFFVIVYRGVSWHYVFYLIYFIGALWISYDNKAKVPETLSLIFKICLYSFLSLFFVFTLNPKSFKSHYLYGSEAVIISNEIKEKNLFENAYKIYTLEHFNRVSLAIIPYFPKYDFMDVWAQKKYNFKSIKTFNGRKFDKSNIDLIAGDIDNSKRNLIISYTSQDKIIDGNNWELHLKNVYDGDIPRFHLYEVKSKRKSLF